MTVAIEVRPDQFMVVAGQRGTGKSVLASSIANRWDRVLIFDPNQDRGAEIPNLAICYGVKAALAAIPGRVLYRPTLAESGSLAICFDKLVRRLFDLGGHHAIVIHELAHIAASDRQLEPATSAWFRSGRRWAMPGVVLTQRPFNIPMLALSEADHAIAFHLVRAEDRKRMAEVMGAEVAEDPIPKDFSFWYTGPDLALVRVAPLPLPR